MSPVTAPGPRSAEILWEPSRQRRRSSRMADFLDFVNERYQAGLETDDYGGLHQWSTASVPRFWHAVCAYFDLGLSVPVEGVLEGRMPTARWFNGAALNYVQRVIDTLNAAYADDSVVVVAANQDSSDLREITWRELRADVARFAATLRRLGVRAGDRVAGYLPNVPETLVAFLASASLGAVWSCCSPDFGASAVLDRFTQIEPAVLVAVDGYRYGDRTFNRTEVIAQLQDALPTLRATIVLPYLHASCADAPATGRLRNILEWDEAVSGEASALLPVTEVPFGHPLWILYSSGTTGLPKPIVHSHGGILLEHLKWMGLHTDIRPGERIFWLTTTGWTMWNFVVGALLVGAVPVLYEGSPGYPDLSVLWRVAEAARVTVFGAGASYYASCAKAGLELRDAGALTALQAVGSTGSPLAPEMYDWIYRQLGPDLWLFSTSGGTDVCTSFVGGTPLLPVRRGQLQAPALGVDVQAWDESGHPVQAGTVGELVVTQPMPSMPVCFWGDEDGSRLHDAYFGTYPGVWRHGDWIEFRPGGGAVIHGRSDSTINRSGVRIGTAEIYRALVTMTSVVDAVVVDVPLDAHKSWMPLFVQLADGLELDDVLRSEILGRIRAACSPRHVPDEVVAVPAVPRTLSGKVLEVPVKRILMGAPAEAVASRDALADAGSLDWFVRYAAAAGKRHGLAPVDDFLH
jgi:acetoacetyl-CoA synthetase